MNGFDKRKELKKQKILKTAYELFSTYGFQKVSIQEIAHKANVSQVTIYNYFGSKDDLLLEAVRSFTFHRINETKEIMEDPKRNFVEKVQLVFFQKLLDKEYLNSDLLQSQVSNHPLLEDFFKDINVNHRTPIMKALIKQGKEQGYIHKDFSEQTILFYLHMYQETMQQHPEWLKNKEQTKQLTEELLQLFFYGLSGSPKKR